MQSLTDLLIDSNPVTFKSLSRTLEIKVNKAREMMMDFHSKNPDILALFLVKEGNKIKLVTKEELDSNEFEIYSLQAKRDQLPLKVKDDQNSFKKCRTRVNNSILVTLEKSRSVPEASVPPPSNIIKKSNSDQHIKNPVKKTTFFSRFKKNASAEKLETKEKPKEKPEGNPVRVVKVNTKPAQKEESQDMDIDEPTDNEQESTDSIQSKESKMEKKQPKVTKAEKEVKEKVEKKERVKSVESNSESQAQQLLIEQMFDDEPDQPKRDPPTEIKRIRKKRKVTRSETFMDGKYMKTRDVEEWESYDDEMEVVAPVEKKITMEKPKKKEKGQMTLTSFFKKK
ncbi:hypothetical protein HK103_000672 [Boothiomyces macroporosus]|uniref:DNA polymerase delta subunit 3 n=1 Tax=Boothiomyces macroporosus TaxID=261099 RepID=A0AAD5UKG7_9FUNG|nr:hypothetical protein HK103_000672 [Boothiomyces macroporosus]